MDKFDGILLSQADERIQIDELTKKLLESNDRIDKLTKELKHVREERCLDALQTVLANHKCQLISLPSGQFQVTYGNS